VEGSFWEEALNLSSGRLLDDDDDDDDDDDYDYDDDNDDDHDL
jgi:hypothetical protein